MLRPILALATGRDITRRTAAAAMEEHFQLTPEERAARIPSGASTYVENRNGWAMTFLTKAGLIAKVAPRIYRITEFGRKYLAEHPDEITERDLRTIPGWEEAWNTKKEKKTPPGGVTTGKTPIEALDDAIREGKQVVVMRSDRVWLESVPELRSYPYIRLSNHQNLYLS